jgi:hypothetical protein
VRKRRQLLHLIALAGAGIVCVAAYAPWMTATIVISENGVTSPPMPQIPLNSFAGLPQFASPDHPIIYFLDFALQIVWCVLTVLGILLVPLLDLRMQRRGPPVGRRLFGVWLALSTLITISAARTLLISDRQRLFPAFSTNQAVPNPGGPWISIPLSVRTHIEFGWGIFVIWLGLALAWAAFILLLRQGVGDTAGWCLRRTEKSPRSRRHRCGGALLSAGITLWTLGFLALPWASVNCAAAPVTLNHFVIGSCAGLDAGDALGSTSLSLFPPITFYSGSSIVLAIYLALTGGALFVLITVWRRPLSRAALGWITVWLLATSATAVLAERGVTAIRANAPQLASAAVGTWHSDMGLLYAVLGLLVGWLGVILLEPVSTSPGAAPAHL